MTATTCPKCASPVPPNGVVCAVCDCILDMSFLELSDLPDLPSADDPNHFDEKTGAETPLLGSDEGFDEKTGAETPAFDRALDPAFDPALDPALDPADEQLVNDLLADESLMGDDLGVGLAADGLDDADTHGVSGTLDAPPDTIDGVASVDVPAREDDVLPDNAGADDVLADDAGADDAGADDAGADDAGADAAGADDAGADDALDNDGGADDAGAHDALDIDGGADAAGADAALEDADDAVAFADAEGEVDFVEDDDDGGEVIDPEAGGLDDGPLEDEPLEDGPLKDGGLDDGDTEMGLGARPGREAPLIEDDLVEGADERGAYGGEAIILGNVGPMGTDFESMLSDATSSIPFDTGGGLARTFEPVTVYVGQNIQKMIEPDAVLGLREGANLGALQLSPFETHVLSFIDGERPVARIRKKAGLGIADLKIAIGMLSDRNLIVVKGHIKPDVRSMLDDGDLDETGEISLPPAAEELPPPVMDVMDLPLDAMTPLPPPPAVAAPFAGAFSVDAPFSRPAPYAEPAPQPVADDDGESVFSGGGPVRAATLKPAMPATVGGGQRRAMMRTPAPQEARKTTPTGAPSTSSPASASTAAPAARQMSAPQPVSVRVAAAQPPDAAAKSKALQVLELGLADLRNGKRARALSYVKMAADLDPTNAKAQALLSDWGKADKLAKSEAEDQLLVADAQRAEDQGQFDRAAELYKKALLLKPNEPELHNRLGIIYALRLSDFSSATNALMKACELDPDNLAYRSNLGKIYKIADGGKPTKLHAGADSDALKDAAKGGKKSGFLDKLRGK